LELALGCFQQRSHRVAHAEKKVREATVVVSSRMRMRTRKKGDVPRRSANPRVLSPPRILPGHGGLELGPPVRASLAGDDKLELGPPRP